MVNPKAPLSKEAKESIIDDLKETPEIKAGLYKKEDFEYVPKNIFDDAQMMEIAEGLKSGLIYVFARGVSRNTQYNVRKKLKEQYPKILWVQVVAKKGGQDGLFPKSV